MKYTVYFKSATNQNITHFRNEARNTRSRVFATLEEAKEFAQTVEVLSVYTSTGKRISL